jgi:hypothetical protein
MAKEDVIPIDIKEIENNFGEFINYLTEKIKNGQVVFLMLYYFIKF